MSSQLPYKVSPLIAAFTTGWALLNRGERLRLVAVSAAQAVMRMIDMVALALVVPVVMVLIQQDTSQSKRIVKFILDNVPGVSAATAIYVAIGGIVALLAISAVGNTLCQYSASRLALNCHTRLIEELMRAVIGAPLTWVARQNSAMLVRMICNDAATLARSFVEGFPSGVGSFATILFGMLLILYDAPLVGLITVVVFGGIAMIIFRVTREKVNYLSAVQRDSLNSLAVGLNQVIDGIKDIRVSGRENYFVDSCMRQTRLYGNAAVLNRLWFAVGPAMLIFLTQTGLLGVALVLWLTDTNHGEVAARLAMMLLVAARLVPAFSRIGTEFGRLAMAEPYMRGLIELRGELAASSRADESAGRTEAIPGDWRAITLSNASFFYPGGQIPALSDFSFEFRRGSSYGIAGPSGAGKSTLVDLLLGLVDATSGAVRIGSVPVEKARLRDWHKRIGFVPQAPFIADDTLRANVAFGLQPDRVDDRRVIECLQAVQLGDFLASCPQGLDTPLGERGALVSGGQRQRIAIARALYARPEIIVLDEATSALDTVNERAIQSVIRDLRGSITVITIAHRITTIRNCDEIVVLNAGRLAACGTYDELLKSSELFRQLAAAAEITAPAELAANDLPTEPKADRVPASSN